MSELTSEQKSAFDQLKEVMPTDLVPGYTVATTGEVDPDSEFLKGMRSYSKLLGENAYAYFNFVGKGKRFRRLRRRPKKILSPEGFPPWVTISYAFPPPRSFQTPSKEREVNHFVMHSFGHGWMATWSKKSRKWIGWMNSKRKKRGVQVHELDGKTIYVAKGSDPETLTHFQRFRAGLGSCLAFSSGKAPNFFIDRAGNLVVIGDCNDIQIASNWLDRHGVAVELEEAFYTLHDTGGSKNKAKFRSDGTPRGTGGNVTYLAYSPQQLLTLSIVCKKIETAYPQIRNRHLSFADRTSTWKNTEPGYAIHDWIKQGKKGGHYDVSPHFITQEFWDAFFELVDSHKHINPTNVFKPRQKYSDVGKSYLVEPLSDDALEAMTDRMLQFARDRGLSEERANNLVNTSKQVTNTEVGTAAAKESLKVSQQVSTTTSVAQQTQSPPVSLPEPDLPIYEVDGQQVCSDDSW